MINEKIQELEGQLKGCAENAEELLKEMAHCPSALAFKARVGHALDMLASLKREAAALAKPPGGSGTAALLLLLLTLAFSLTPAAFGQIIYGAANVTNGALSCPVQQSFTPVVGTEQINVAQHSAQVLNVCTNQTIYLAYGRQPQGASGTNLTAVATLTTNFTAAWTFATYGYTTNNFSWTYTFPPVQTTSVDQIWGTFSNALGSNAVSFF